MSFLQPQAWSALSEDERNHCMRWAAHPGRHLLRLDEPGYPSLLRQIADPPPLLFVRGNADVLDLPQIGIVGTRHPTADGRNNARAFAAGLSAAGYVITSGMAIGIDTEAHLGTLDGDGITIAILGAGLDCIRSKESLQLAEKIAKRGAVVSEFLPETQAHPANFPFRNRIISGLSRGVVVIEAAERSGSLITARLAGEQGREVFAVPGAIRNPRARGCHKLIRQGAKLADSTGDILEDLPAPTSSERERVVPIATRGVLTRAQRRVLEHVAYDPVSIDTLLQRTRCELTELYTQLMTLELGGFIERRGDGYVLSTR